MGNIDEENKKIVRENLQLFLSVFDEDYNINVIVENKTTKEINIVGNTKDMRETLELINKGISHYKTAIKKNSN